MKGIEVNYAKSAVFREPAKALVEAVRFIVPEGQVLKHVSIDVKAEKIIAMYEEERNAAAVDGS